MRYEYGRVSSTTRYKGGEDGVAMMKELLEKGISVHVLNMGLVENTPTGKLILHIMAALRNTSAILSSKD